MSVSSMNEKQSLGLSHGRTSISPPTVNLGFSSALGLSNEDRLLSYILTLLAADFQIRLPVAFGHRFQFIGEVGNSSGVRILMYLLHQFVDDVKTASICLAYWACIDAGTAP